MSSIGSPAAAERFYTIDRSNDELGLIDTAASTYQAVGAIGFDMHYSFLTYHNGTLYALTGNSDTGFAETAWTLVGINPATGNMTSNVNVTYNNNDLFLAGGIANVNGSLAIAFRDPSLGGGGSGSYWLGDLSLSGVISNANDYAAFNADFDAIAASPSGQLYSVDGIPGQQTFNLYSVSRLPLDYALWASFVGGTVANPYSADDISIGSSGIYVMNLVRSEIYCVDFNTQSSLTFPMPHPGSTPTTLSGLQIVPEPSSISLFAVALIGAALLMSNRPARSARRMYSGCKVSGP